MGRPKTNKMKVCISDSENVYKALNIFSESVHLSKSDIISIAVSNYLIQKDEFKNNPKAKELLKESQI